jgi:hypothetical protein
VFLSIMGFESSKQLNYVSSHLSLPGVQASWNRAPGCTFPFVSPTTCGQGLHGKEGKQVRRSGQARQEQNTITNAARPSFRPLPSSLRPRSFPFTLVLAVTRSPWVPFAGPLPAT